MLLNKIRYGGPVVKVKKKKRVDILFKIVKTIPGISLAISESAFQFTHTGLHKLLGLFFQETHRTYKSL